MKKELMTLLALLSSVTLHAKEGYSNRINNKTEHPLKVSIFCTQACDKNDATCKTADGYVVIIPPHKTVSVKKDNGAYEIENPRHENAFKLELQINGGQTKIPPKMIHYPGKKRLTITFDDNIIVVK